MTRAPISANVRAWVIQQVCGGTSRPWKRGGWRRRDCCDRGSASPRWPERSASIGSRSAAGRGSLKNPGCAACARPSAPAGQPSSARPSCATSSARSSAGPRRCGFASGLWTASRVRDLIEDRTGVRYHEDHVWRILRKLDWTCQRPTGQALERDEEAIRQWKKVAWPQIKKKPSARGAPSSSSTKAD